ncbi:methyltransferase domain-containing protein [Pseudohalocynthiibacter aestuariivivens]|nr:methyltransferase domain-containing protein [Pseudohalocynthiibacter aestuariivivens]QIE44063.1 methyltransferase domain-containing protein [Pseudohalocynthiibacter aestuariivivens]
MSDFDAFHRLEEAGWSDPATAADYAAHFATAATQCVPGTVDAVRARPGIRALDLCCGHGNVARGLMRAGADVTGLDFSDAMLDMARAAVPEARFVQGDAMALPFEADTFDAVTIGFGVPHIPYPDRAFAEAHRVLRSGGRFAYTVWRGDDPVSAFPIVFGAIAAHGDPSVALPPGPATHEFADADVAETALNNAGFSAVTRTIIPAVWQMDDPGDVFDYFLQGTVRGGALLRPQPDAAKVAIRTAIVDRIKALCGDAGPWTVPVPAVLIAATA